MNAFKLFQNLGFSLGPSHTKFLNNLNNITSVGEAGGGMVRATMNANGKLLDVKIDQKLMGKDKQVIEELIVHACNNARDYSIKAAEEEAAKMVKDLPDMSAMLQSLLSNMNKKPE